MSEEKKQIASEEEEQMGISANDNDQNQNIDATSETSDYYSNDAIYAIHDLRPTPNTELVSLSSGGQQVETSDVLMIEELPKELSQEQSSNEELNAAVEYPSDLEEDCHGYLPQAYFDNRKNLHPQEKLTVLKIKDIHRISEIRQNKNGNQVMVPNEIIRHKHTISELREKISRAPETVNKSCKDSNDPIPFNDTKKDGTCETTFKFVDLRPDIISDTVVPGGTKFVDHSSDEFADIEDNAVDSYDSYSDSSESFGSINSASIFGISFKNQLGNLPLDAKAKQGHKAEDSNSKALKEICIKCSSNSSEPHEENKSNHAPESKNVPVNMFESCSYSAQTKSKNLKVPSLIITKEGKTVKKNLSTVVEIPELEENSQNLKSKQPSCSKTKTLKMKTRVGTRKDKCNVCNVRLGLCAIKCRCGGYYCAKHRYDKEHNCTFDYRSMGAEEIRKNNPKVIAEKVRKL